MKFLGNRRVYRLRSGDLDLEVDSARPGISAGGTLIALRQKTFLVLLHLLEHPDRVVSKEELLDSVWRDTVVTEGTLSQCLVDLRRAFGDDARSPRYLKTFPKTGYQLVCEVEDVTPRAPEIVPSEPAAELPAVEPPVSATPSLPPVRRRPGLLLAVTAAALLTAGIGLTLATRRREPDPHLPKAPGRTGVAVLFFENRSRVGEVDWLREGLADMLIADLSRSSRLALLSRQQLGSILRKMGHEPGSAVDLTSALEVGRRSGATALVLGTFTRIGETTRLDVELHDVKTGHLLGVETDVAERPEQILTRVDLVAARLSARLGAPLGGEESRRSLREVRTRDLDAYRYYSLALERAQAVKTDEAVALLQKAIALDPDFAMAHARIGYALTVIGNQGAAARPYLARALAHGSRLTPADRRQVEAWDAIARADWPAAIEAHRRLLAELPGESEAYVSLGRLLLGEERSGEAFDVLRRGLDAAPQDGQLHNLLSAGYSEVGRHDEAIAEAERYVALEPREANALDTLASAYQWAGRYEQALASYDRALALDPDFAVAVIHRGNCLVELGRYREALAAFARFSALVAPGEKARGVESVSLLYIRKGELDAAEPFARQAQESKLPRLQAAWLLAETRGRNEEAAGLAQRLVATRVDSRGRRPAQRPGSFVRGVRALRSGRTEEALAALREAVGHRPVRWAFDPLETCLADAYLELDRLPEAVAEYERILGLNPRAPMPLYRLGLALERLGRRAEAAERLREFVDVWKDADGDVPELVDARRRLGEARKAHPTRDARLSSGGSGWV